MFSTLVSRQFNHLIQIATLMLWWIVLLTVKVHLTIASRVHSGIKNGSNACFANSLIQALYHLPPIREAIKSIVLHETADEAHPLCYALAGAFELLDDNKQRVSFHRGLYKELRNFDFDVNTPDDPLLVLNTIYNTCLLGRPFNMEEGSKLLYDYLVQMEIMEAVYFKECLVMKVPLMPTFACEFGYLDDQLSLEDRLNTPIKESKSFQILLPPSDDEYRSAIEFQLGQHIPWYKETNVHLITRITSLAPISAFVNHPHRPAITKFPLKFRFKGEVDGVKYHLMAAICYRSGHYWTVARTELRDSDRRDVFHKFNDERVSRFREREELEDELLNARIAFYMRDDFMSDMRAISQY